MISPIVISHIQTRPLLAERHAIGHKVSCSLDLGFTSIELTIHDKGVFLPAGDLLGWETLNDIGKAKNNCFIVHGSDLEKITRYSEQTNRVYGLMPTSAAPTLLVSGIPMHRIKDTTPDLDTLEKIKAIKPIHGHILDTSMGLGYTAIEAAKYADQVTTIELEQVVEEIASINPWSRDLFINRKIKRIIADSSQTLPDFEDGTFSAIIHDPPVLSLAGDLYGLEYYQQLYRVLHSGGKLFHYVGDPNSHSGRNVTRGVVERLNRAGFYRVRRQPRAFGVAAYK